MGYEIKEFGKDVLEASNTTPVVVDFWAEWCGPCRQLGPTIEKLAGEAKGRWKLVKIDTDKNPDLAIQLGVRGIPAIKMVYQQEIIAEFTGAQPEHLIRKWLADNLPDHGASDTEDIAGQIKEMLGRGDREGAVQILEKNLEDDSDPDLFIHYAMLLLPELLEQSRRWLEKAGDLKEKYEIELEAFRTVEHLYKILEGEVVLKGDNENTSQLYHRGVTDLFKKDFDGALSKFIECLQLDRTLDEDGPRKACIACFAMLGEQHPLSLKYRRLFSMSLY